MPSPEELLLLQPFPRMGLDRIVVVASASEAALAADALLRAEAWGFDTESKPTFQAGEASEGPHVIQLATLERAFVFQLHDEACRAVAGELLAREGIVKAGFGLREDRKRIQHKLGVAPQDVLDLDTVFRQRGYRRQMGIKAAVAVLFGQRYQKSKRATTSNWARRELSESQLLYAANDAWAALCVYYALRETLTGSSSTAAPAGR
ncbi:3'-5' exonuclease [Ramlibacter monticola]|uniref:3'-5' exonuclease n=1 Tax=Ramlibacter monticola TaxID=1926872 RepID=UPI0038B66B5F